MNRCIRDDAGIQSTVISTGATADKIEKQALAEGMLTLKMGAAKHVLNGITSMSEMKKIVYTTGDEY